MSFNRGLFTLEKEKKKNPDIFIKATGIISITTEILKYTNTEIAKS